MSPLIGKRIRRGPWFTHKYADIANGDYNLVNDKEQPAVEGVVQAVEYDSKNAHWQTLVLLDDGRILSMNPHHNNAETVIVPAEYNRPDPLGLHT